MLAMTARSDRRFSNGVKSKSGLKIPSRSCSAEGTLNEPFPKGGQSWQIIRSMGRVFARVNAKLLITVLSGFDNTGCLTVLQEGAKTKVNVSTFSLFFWMETSIGGHQSFYIDTRTHFSGMQDQRYLKSFVKCQVPKLGFCFVSTVDESRSSDVMTMIRMRS